MHQYKKKKRPSKGMTLSREKKKCVRESEKYLKNTNFASAKEKKNSKGRQ